MSKAYQWKHGNWESDLYEDKLQAMHWALRATTGADDDGIAVRELEVGDWQRVNYEGYMDPEPVVEFEVGDIVVHTFHRSKVVGRVVDLKGPTNFGGDAYATDSVLVEYFGREDRAYWKKDQMTLIARDPR